MYIYILIFFHVVRTIGLETLRTDLFSAQSNPKRID